jgi:dihydrofolate reductase
MNISIIAAIAENRAIGKDNKLLWKLPADMKLFKALTTDHYVLMGRKTFDSMGSKPLSNRVNVIITRQKGFAAEHCLTCHSLEEAIHLAEEEEETEAFIIGGAEIYQMALEVADTMYLTQVHAQVEGDSFFPLFDHKQWELVEKTHYTRDDKNEYNFDFCVYKRKGR